MKQFEYTLQIREHHLDTFGHVNNATYLALYEEARWEFITENGFGLDVIQKIKQGPVILEVNIRYKREIINRDLIKIRSTPMDNKGKIMKIHQQMINQNDQVCSEATFTVGYMDFAQRKLVIPSHKWLKAIGAE